MSAEKLISRLDALWLEMNDALAEPPATARILNALHDASQALRTPQPDALPGDLREALEIIESAPVLVINGAAARASGDEAALQYAVAVSAWAKRAKAFVALIQSERGGA